jgi:MFS family permease
MSQTIQKKTKISIIFIALAEQIAWMVENQYFNVFLYEKIAPVPMYISIMVAASAIVATFTSIIMGSYSDVKGKRKSLLLFGFIFWTITTSIFPFSALFPIVEVAIATAIIFDCIMTFFGSTAYDATFNAYITDITTLENRGKALSLVQIMTLISILITYGFAGVIIEILGYFIFFFIVGGLVGIFGITGAYLAEKPKELKFLDRNVLEHLKTTFKRENLLENKDIFLVLTGATIWGIGFNIFFPFIIVYLKNYPPISLDILTASLVVFIAFLIAMIASYPVGVAIDKIGRKKFTIISIIFESISLIFFAFIVDLPLLILFGTIWVFFMTTWTISSNTWIKDLYPEKKYGQFSGYFILFTVLFTMIPGPLIGGWLSETYGIPFVDENGIPGHIPVPIMFVVAAIIILLAVVPLLFASEQSEKSEANPAK